jgi:two-component system, OmpR family, alkaline phosphatase synthesis response regulator PhoP
MTRILVVEDNHNLARMVQHNLTLEGYIVDVAHDGVTGLTRGVAGDVDLAVLDLMIPRLNGFELLRRWRAEGVTMPVVVLTSLGEETSKLRGFRLGADDYVTKPFSILELAARIGALLRRTRRHDQGSTDGSGVLTFGDLRIHTGAHRVERTGSPVDLRPKEYALLMALVRRDGRVVTRDELLQEVWGYSAEVVSRTVDTHIAELRRKLEADPREPRHLITVRKTGFRFEP